MLNPVNQQHTPNDIYEACDALIDKGWYCWDKEWISPNTGIAHSFSGACMIEDIEPTFKEVERA
jgi:hypothetical protein